MRLSIFKFWTKKFQCPIPNSNTIPMSDNKLKLKSEEMEKNYHLLMMPFF